MTAAPERLRALPDSAAYRRGEQIGWGFYDWANSAFSTTVATVFLGPYLTAVARAAADQNGFVYPLGIPVRDGAFFPYVVSLSVFLQVLVLPIVGALGDYSNRKKELMALCAYVGAFATLGLYFLSGTDYLLGGALFLIANVSFGASVVLYNAFLPEIAPPSARDAVSSVGWALGYAGGGLLLFLNVVLFSQAASFGLTSEAAVRISLASAGLWWAVFTLVPLATIRTRRPLRPLPAGERLLTVGFRQLRQTLSGAARYPQTLLFLAAYLLYNDGVQTVIALASVYGEQELGFSIGLLTTVILMVQFVAFFGALLFGLLARVLGTRRAILLSLVIWIVAVVGAYFAQRGNTVQFFGLAALIALVLGGTQALSRAAYSLMIPRGQEAEYFSIYEVSERGTSWLGPLLFGLVFQLTGSYRDAIFSLIVFFVLGFALLARVDLRRAAAAVGNVAPAA